MFATSLAFCTVPCCTKGLFCDLGHLVKGRKRVLWVLFQYVRFISAELCRMGCKRLCGKTSNLCRILTRHTHISTEKGLGILVLCSVQY